MSESPIPSDILGAVDELAEGRYELQRELGQGGMATVFLADDTRLDRQVAIKVLHRHLIRDTEHCARFRREAESIAGLSHPGLVQIHDLLEKPGEFLAMVIEYVDGPSLRELLDDCPPMPPELAATTLLPVLEALQHAHDRRIVHRDFKPENILFDEHSQPRLADFGIAHVIDQQTLTDTGAILGSPAYMSPEGVLGKSIDARTDLFAVGSVLYRMVTGRLPFVGLTPNSIMQDITVGDYERADHICERVGRRFSAIIDRFLSTDPDDRPPSATQAAELLRQFVAESMGDQTPDLARFVAAPVDYPSELEKQLFDDLLQQAHQAASTADRARALDIAERLMAIDTDDPRPVELLDSLHDTGSAPRRKTIAVAVFAIVIAATAAVTGWAFLQSPQKPTPQPTAATAPDHETDPDHEHETDPDPDPDHETETDPDTDHETEIDPEPEIDPDTETETEIDPDTDTETDPDPETDHETETETDPDHETETDPEPEIDPDTETEIDPDTETEPEIDPETDPDPELDPEPDPDPATRTVSFQLVPASATLTVNGDEFDALDASGGIDLTYGTHTVVAEGPGAQTTRKDLDVHEDTDPRQPVVLDWKDGYIRVAVDRDALMWVDDADSPQTIDPTQDHLVPVTFGPADEVENRREVTVRVAPRDDLQNATERTVEVRPDSETPVAFTLHD